MSLNHPHQPRRAGRAWACSLLILLTVVGCGGVDSGGTGAPAVASGPITGFGSVIVNGVHFDDTKAIVTDADGVPHVRGDLKLGMTTVIAGSAIVTVGTGSSSVATNIVFGSEILGPVEAIDPSSNSLVALGQTVDVTPTTVFDSGLNGGQSALAVGDVIEVYALFNAAANRYAATRIERKTGVTAYRLRGVVSGLDTASKSFIIGGGRISYNGLAASDVPAALADGRLVRVQLQTVPSNGAWQATSVRDGVRKLDDHDESLAEGLISAFTSSAQFSVDGVAVDASHATFANGTAGLTLGARVAIEGTAIGGVLVASRVEVKTETDVEHEGFELDGMIATLDAAAKTLVIRDVSVDYSGTVDLRNGSLSDLAVGRRVEINGMLSLDGTRVQATRIDFKP